MRRLILSSIVRFMYASARLLTIWAISTGSWPSKLTVTRRLYGQVRPRQTGEEVRDDLVLPRAGSAGDCCVPPSGRSDAEALQHPARFLNRTASRSNDFSWGVPTNSGCRCR